MSTSPLSPPPDPVAVPVAPLDLSTPQRLHIVGVGGPGMSAIAIALAEMGHRVSGSDIREQPVLDRVRAAGVDVHVGHDRAHVEGCDAVTSSTAVPATNVELRHAVDLGIPTLRRAGMLASICAMARTVAVAGTHGKTTTTSMLMLSLAEGGMRPGFVVGGDVTDAGTGAQWTGSEWFVVEADESDGTHVELPLFGTIVTNLEVDHLDHYGTFERYLESFERYLATIPGPKVLCADDERCAALAARFGGITYGLAESAEFRAVDVVAASGAFTFTVEHRGTSLGTVHLPMRGVHNVINATGVIAMASELGVPFVAVAAALARFGGVARRFDVRGVDGGATFVDDYAHLPTEIRAVLAGARGSGDGWKRVIAVFQPNRFNRMSRISREYADAFVDADVVVLTEIYASGTTPIPGVTGQLVVDAVLERHPETRLVWLPRREDMISFLAGEVGEGDVCISMGCGDIATLPDEVLDRRQVLRIQAVGDTFPGPSGTGTARGVTAT
ncbi:UDP-N-acetylmuramate--L-alanine ligase [Desertimonas flava]|uniref:UDP-N-acetylmuramate--L-alanine ligase n=1 Tax=Desertimonas flava TaxID=2064846 RepID=UPI0013C438EA|nr:UDP-N-acetylmuramate--L-alanine ligase [Desertimonas flava]